MPVFSSLVLAIFRKEVYNNTNTTYHKKEAMRMFSNQPRQRFAKNQLIEVICQLRFPEILSIEANAPAEFQDRIRAEFPFFHLQRENQPPKMVGTPGNIKMQPQSSYNNYYFISEDRLWRVNLTSKFISLSSNHYVTWEEFAKKLDGPLAAFIQIYKPAFFERIGLRYVNAFSRTALNLSGTPFRDLIQPWYLGVLACENLPETSTSRNSYDLELRLKSDTAAKIHAGPGLLQRQGKPKDIEPKFILDLDLYQATHTQPHFVASVMQILHQQADSIFLGAITEELKEALEPCEFL